MINTVLVPVNMLCRPDEPSLFEDHQVGNQRTSIGDKGSEATPLRSGVFFFRNHYKKGEVFNVNYADMSAELNC